MKPLLSQSQDFIYLRISELFEEGGDDDERDWPLFAAAQTLFDGCMDEEAIERNGFKSWRLDVERVIQVYPMGRIFWRKSQFDPTEMVSLAGGTKKRDVRERRGREKTSKNPSSFSSRRARRVWAWRLS